MKRFIVVTGLPASGKTTIGAAIASALGLPLLDKDVILESLFETEGVGDEVWRSRLSRAADGLLHNQALASQGAVIASWWRHPLSTSSSGAAPDWLAALPGDVVELYCRCSPRSAVERFFARQRHMGHLDGLKSRPQELAKFQQFAAHGALGLRRVVELDTERPTDLVALLRALEPPAK
ncbi:MAG: AAA family ATPase [Pseudomonadota bacterium]